MNNIIVIQARMGSTRFPGKVMLPLGGKPVLEWVIDGAKEINKYIGGEDQLIRFDYVTIIVATTTGAEDDVIAECAFKNGIECRRFTDPENVYDRYWKCADEFDADYIVRLTADNPAIDIEAARSIAYQVISNKWDYGNVDSVGRRSEIISWYALNNLCVDREHVTKDAKFRTSVTIKIPDGITLDTPEDYEKLKAVYG